MELLQVSDHQTFSHSFSNFMLIKFSATGSDYFSLCFPLHIPSDSDLVFVELGVNDEALPEHYENMENLIKGLIEMPNRPAVVLVEVVAFSAGSMGGSGGMIHL